MMVHYVLRAVLIITQWRLRTQPVLFVVCLQIGNGASGGLNTAIAAHALSGGQFSTTLSALQLCAMSFPAHLTISARSFTPQHYQPTAAYTTLHTPTCIHTCTLHDTGTQECCSV
jgi:hypothetical protein